MNRKTWGLFCLAALAGCAETGSRPRPQGIPKLTQHWLVGGWVLEGESCDSDAGLLYKPDGRWVTLGTAGTWRLEGNHIVTTITAQEDRSDRDGQAGSSSRRIETITVTGPDSFVVRSADGSTMRLLRCNH